VYKREKYTKTSFDGTTETIEKEERHPSGLLELCIAILMISLSILTVTLILQSRNHASSNRGLDRPINQFDSGM
jgi:hypothetical protein